MSNAKSADVSSPIVDADFADAVHAAADGRPQMLAKLIRAIPGVSNEILLLADFFDGNFTYRRGNHAPVEPPPKVRRAALFELLAFQRKGNTHKQSLGKISEDSGISEEALALWCKNPSRHSAAWPNGYEPRHEGFRCLEDIKKAVQESNDRVAKKPPKKRRKKRNK